MADALDRLAAEAANGTEPVSVPLGGKTVRVMHPMDWRSSAMEALQVGNFQRWAQMCLVNDAGTDADGNATGSDDAAIWLEVDPTNRQVVQFLIDYRNAGGSGLGE